MPVTTPVVRNSGNVSIAVVTLLIRLLSSTTAMVRHITHVKYTHITHSIYVTRCGIIDLRTFVRFFVVC